MVDKTKDEVNRTEISFVLPCYNAGSYLLEAINSIRQQEGSFSISEIIVVDDRSNDPGTLAALDAVSKEEVHVVRNDSSQGPGGARNFGVSIARSRFISFLDADDALPPGSVSARVDALGNEGTPSFVGGDFLLWWGSDRFEPRPFFASRERPSQILGPALETGRPLRLAKPAHSFLEATLCHCGTLLVEKELFQTIGGFDEQLRFCEDHLFFIRLASIADYIFVPGASMWYRQHDSSITHAPFCPSEKYSAALRRLLELELATELRRSVVKRTAALDTESAKWYRQHGQFNEAMKASLRALAHDWRDKDALRQFVASSLRRP